MLPYVHGVSKERFDRLIVYAGLVFAPSSLGVGYVA